MKKFSFVLLTLGAWMIAPSCKTTDFEAKNQMLQDSLTTIFPTWQAAKIWVDDNNTLLHVVIGDISYYDAGADTKASKGQQLGKMVSRIYGPDAYLKTVQFTVTKDVRNTSKEPSDGISQTIPLEK